MKALGGFPPTRTAMTSMLFGSNPSDFLTFAGEVLLQGAVALLACSIPARHASRVDPMVALRDE